MDDGRGLFRGQLGGLPFSAGVVTRQISAENPTGEKGRRLPLGSQPRGPQPVPQRGSGAPGAGWKVRPFVRVAAGELVTLADIEGPGCLNEVFITSNLPELRALVLRFYWDGEAQPSVEVPVGDFFAIGHDAAPHLVSSLPVAVGPHRGAAATGRCPSGNAPG